MTRGVRLVVDYSNIDKPFGLIERVHDLGGTDYFTICRLSEDHARLLGDEGISWLYGKPDWNEHHRKIALYKAERDKKEAEKRIADLTPTDKPTNT